MKSIFVCSSLMTIAYSQYNGAGSGYISQPTDECFVGFSSTMSYEYDCDTESVIFYSSSTDCTGSSVSSSFADEGYNYTCDATDGDFVTVNYYNGSTLNYQIGLVLENCVGAGGSYAMLDCCDSEEDLCFTGYTDADCTSSGSSILLSEWEGVSVNGGNYTVPSDCTDDSDSDDADTDSDDLARRLDMGVVGVLVVAAGLLR